METNNIKTVKVNIINENFKKSPADVNHFVGEIMFIKEKVIS